MQLTREMVHQLPVGTKVTCIEAGHTKLVTGQVYEFLGYGEEANEANGNVYEFTGLILEGVKNPQHFSRFELTIFDAAEACYK